MNAQLQFELDQIEYNANQAREAVIQKYGKQNLLAEQIAKEKQDPKFIELIATRKEHLLKQIESKKYWIRNYQHELNKLEADLLEQEIKNFGVQTEIELIDAICNKKLSNDSFVYVVKNDGLLYRFDGRYHYPVVNHVMARLKQSDNTMGVINIVCAHKIIEHITKYRD